MDRTLASSLNGAWQYDKSAWRNLMTKSAKVIALAALCSISTPALAAVIQFEIFGGGSNPGVAQQNALANATVECQRRGGQLVGFGGQLISNGPNNFFFVGTAQCDVP